VEVCLAVLVIGLGLLPIFGLLPSGLRSAEESTADTRCGLFAESVMNGVRGNAAQITAWNAWTTTVTFTDTILDGVLTASGPPPTPTPAVPGSIQTVIFPEGGSEYLRYRLTVNANQHSVLLEVCDGQYGGFYPEVTIYSELVYKGM
jgi:hypothetical protein